MKIEDVLEPEDCAQLQAAVIAILEKADARIGLDQEFVRKLLAERGFRIVPADVPVRH